MWLGELFAESGCQAIPALNCRQGLSLAMQSQSPVGVLIINPELRGARRLINLLKLEDPALRVVLIRDSAAPFDDRHSVLRGIEAHSTLERPAPWEPISQQEWVMKLRRALS